MYDNNKIPPECDKRIIKLEEELWYKLHENYNWLYVINKPVIITLNCRKDP